MSNSRAHRRALAVSRKAIVKRRKDRAARGRWPFGGPSLSTMRRWMKQLEAAGLIRRCGVERTGKPGRPAQLYELTEAGKQRPQSELTVREQIIEERVLRLLRRARGKALTEDQVWAAYKAAMAPAEAS